MQNMYIYAQHNNPDISAVLLKLSQNTQSLNFNQVALQKFKLHFNQTHIHMHACSPVNTGEGSFV